MLQEFFKTSMYCKAIKYILSQTALPLYRTITSDEYIIQGCTYIYKDKILQCTKSGMFLGLNTANYTEDHLYVNEHITVSDDPDYVKVRKFVPIDGELKSVYEYDYLKVTDDVIRQYYRPFAEYRIVDDYEFGQFIPGMTHYHISNVNYYDSQTHRYLGEYLRCLRDIKGIDLMSLYNCFTYQFADNVYISPKTKRTYIEEELPSTSKVALIPIKFNKKYTIALDCPFKVYLKSIFYKDYLLRDLDGESLLTERLTETFKSFNSISFKHPITYEIKVDEPDMLKYEKYLYLAIQLPSENTSSITVLEGDYTTISDLYVSDVSSMDLIPDAQVSNIFKTQLSLLSHNDNKQHPFSNKLIEYLLENTIDSRELVNENISKIETEVGYTPRFKGHWSNTLRYILYNKYMNLDNSTKLVKKDILGFVDSELEDAISRGYIKNA